MIEIETKVDVDGRSFYGELGMIESTMLGYEDHGIFTFNLVFKFPGSGQGAGNFALDQWDEEKDRRIGSAVGLDLIIKVLETAGVGKWESLKGRQLIVLREDNWGLIKGLLNPLTRKALIFDDHFKEWGIGD